MANPNERLKLTDAQALAAGPLLTEGLVFVGEYRGESERLQAYDVKDQKSGKVIEEVRNIIPQFLIEIQPTNGLPRSMMCELYTPKGEEPKRIVIDRGTPVLAVVRSMEFNKFAQQIVTKVEAVFPLKEGAPANYVLGKGKEKPVT